MTPTERSPVADWQFTSVNETQTDELARALADALEPGTVVALIGTLGAGKTRLVRSVCEALGVDSHEVASPTFVLVHEYEGRLPVYHFDTYRLREPSDFLKLGADEYMSSGGVCLIEWADRVRELLPADHLWIKIVATGATQREFTFAAKGPKSARVLERLKAR